MRKLYEIDKAIEDCILAGTDIETGEFKGWEELNELQMEKTAKLEGVALFIKDSRAEAKAILDEVATLEKRIDKLLNNAAGAEAWLANALKGEKFTTPKVECNFRKSVSVECDESFAEWAVGAGLYSFVRHIESDRPDKAKIKEFLKNGGQLEHCMLVEKNNISVR